MRSGVMRIRHKSRFRWRIISWPAANGIRCVKPSRATDIPSCTYSAMASWSERKAAISYAVFCLKKKKLTSALHDNIISIDDLIALGRAASEEGLAAVFGHELQHRVLVVSRLVLEVQARYEV